MLIYISLTLGRKLTCIEARIWLGLSSIVIMLCAMIMGVGIGCMFQLDINILVTLIPFILLGVGVDDYWKSYSWLQGFWLTYMH